MGLVHQKDVRVMEKFLPPSRASLSSPILLLPPGPRLSRSSSFPAGLARLFGTFSSARLLPFHLTVASALMPPERRCFWRHPGMPLAMVLASSSFIQFRGTSVPGSLLLPANVPFPVPRVSSFLWEALLWLRAPAP